VLRSRRRNEEEEKSFFVPFGGLLAKGTVKILNVSSSFIASEVNITHNVGQRKLVRQL